LRILGQPCEFYPRATLTPRCRVLGRTRLARNAAPPLSGVTADGGQGCASSSARIQPVAKKDVRLAQKMQIGPCISVGTQLEKAEVGPTSGPTWRLSHSGSRRAGLQCPDFLAAMVAEMDNVSAADVNAASPAGSLATTSRRAAHAVHRPRPITHQQKQKPCSRNRAA
jgi:hypothetical protein